MKNWVFFFFLTALAALAGCSDDNNSPNPEYYVEIMLDEVETEADISQIDEVKAMLDKSEPEPIPVPEMANPVSFAADREMRVAGRTQRLTTDRTAIASAFASVGSRQESGDDDLYVVGSASRSGNTFRIALKTSIPSQYVTPVTEYFANYGDESCEVVFSDPDAKCSDVAFFIGYRQGEQTGEFWSETLTYPTVPEGEPEVSGEPKIRFIYVDRPVTIKGFDYPDGYNDWFDLSFQKGWNRYCWYNRPDDGSYFIVSDIPAAHKWVYESDLVWPI